MKILKNSTIRRIALGIALMGVPWGFLASQTRTELRDSVSVKVYFRQGYSVLDTLFRDNGRRLEDFVRQLDQLRSQGNDIVFLDVRGAASPEGTMKLNQRLSEKRASAIMEFLRRRTVLPEDKWRLSTPGVDWDGLRDFVASSLMPDREAFLEILDNSEDPVVRRSRLYAFKSGDPYRFVYRTFYPDLRASEVVAVLSRWVEIPEPEPEPESEPQVQEEPQPMPEVAPDTVNEDVRAKETVLNLKTNLLYDAVTALNFEVEVPIGKRYSIAVEDVFPWWEFSKNKTAFQNWEMGVEGRYWLRPWTWNTRKMLGHFLGVYAMSGRGDLQLDDDPDKQWHYWSGGVTYGYVLPLGRKHHWGNLELSVSAGYLRGRYQHYWPAEDYSVLYRDRFNSGHSSYVGPTKLKVSLIIPVNIFTQRATREARWKLGEGLGK